MGIFRTLFSGIKKTAKYGFSLAGAYTFFGYFYVQEIKHRLGDSQQCQKIWFESIKKEILTNYNKEQDDLSHLTIYMIAFITKIYTFYSRIWHYREYEKNCLLYCRNVIQPILRNYEEYGIFKYKEQMQKQIDRNEVTFNKLYGKILHVKELNTQINYQFSQDYLKLIGLQVALSTGNIIGLNEEECKKIYLIFNYVQKGEKYLIKDEKQYWTYKMIQNQLKKHPYKDVIFKIFFI